MSKIKVAHIVCDLLQGGGQKSALDLIGATDNELENYLILLEDKKIYNPDGVRVFSVVKDKKKYKKLDMIGDYLLSVKLNRILESLNIDIVVSHMEVTAKVVRFIKSKKIYYIRTDITRELQTLKEKSIFRYIKRDILYKKNFSDQCLITISKDTEKKISKYITCKKIETIYNPFDVKKIKILSEESSRIQMTYDYIIQIGNDMKVKRQDILLEAFSMIENKEIKLLLLGTERSDTILNLIKKFNIDEDRVVFYPYTTNPYPFIKQAKLLVLSSQREGLPRVIVESLILKTPVVSTDCDTGPREILVDELRRFLARVNDPKDLSEKIDLALQNYPTIEEKYIEQFDITTIKEKFIKYLHEAKSNA